MRCGKFADDSDVPPRENRPLSDLRKDNLTARWVVDAVLFDEVDSAEEMLGEASLYTNREHYVTQEIVEYAQTFVDRLRRLGEFRGYVDAFSDFYAVDDDVAVTIDLDWQIHEPGENWYDRIVAFWSGRTRICVYQPRPFHPLGKWRQLRANASDLDEWREAVEKQVAAIRAGTAGAVVGPPCPYCPRRGRCQTLANRTYAEIQVEDGQTRDGVMSGSEIAAELEFLEEAKRNVEARLSGLTAEATTRVRDGLFVPGRYVDTPVGRRRIASSAAVVKLLTGKSLFKDVPKTPSDLEREGVPKTVVDSLCDRPLGRPALRKFDQKTVDAIFPKPEE